MNIKYVMSNSSSGTAMPHIRLIYTDGEVCGHHTMYPTFRSTEINIICDVDATGGGPILVKQDACVTKLEWRHVAGCPVCPDNAYQSEYGDYFPFSYFPALLCLFSFSLSSLSLPIFSSSLFSFTRSLLFSLLSLQISLTHTLIRRVCERHSRPGVLPHIRVQWAVGMEPHIDAVRVRTPPLHSYLPWRL